MILSFIACGKKTEINDIKEESVTEEKNHITKTQVKEVKTISLKDFSQLFSNNTNIEEIVSAKNETKKAQKRELSIREELSLPP